MSTGATCWVSAPDVAVALTFLAWISLVDLNATSSILAMPRFPGLFMGPCGAQSVNKFSMRELRAFFAAPFRRSDGLVFALFLEFRECLLDQRAEQDVREVDSLGKISPAGGIGFQGAVQQVVEEV